MTAIQRNVATHSQLGVGEATLRGGGDGRSLPTGGAAAKVGKKVRYSHDPAAELMPAAEFLGHSPDFHAILEEFEDGPLDPRRRRVLGRLMGVFAMDYQGARTQERRFLRRLLMSRNAREAYAGNRGLHLCQVGAAVRRTLAIGIAESRFERGRRAGFIGAVQARVAATTFNLLGPKGREIIWNLLTVAGRLPDGSRHPSAEPVLERCLILKALGARRDHLGPWNADGAEALREVSDFAGAIRCMPKEVMANRTTLYGPEGDEALGNLAQPVSPIRRATLLARAEVDPTFAWETHFPNGLDLPGVNIPSHATAAVPDQELDDLTALPDLDRNPLQDRVRIHWALAETRKFGWGQIEPYEREALVDHIGGRDLGESRGAHRDKALEKLMNRGWDVARTEAFEAIRRDSLGIYRFKAAAGLGQLLSRFTGAVYVRRVMSDQLTAGADPISQIERAQRMGMFVPMTIGRLKKTLLVGWAILVGQAPDRAEGEWTLRDPAADIDLGVPGKALLQPQLAPDFGDRARVDAYLAPAPLDLLAPPFGIEFPTLGIEDSLG